MTDNPNPNKYPKGKITKIADPSTNYHNKSRTKHQSKTYPNYPN